MIFRGIPTNLHAWGLNGGRLRLRSSLTRTVSSRMTLKKSLSKQLTSAKAESAKTERAVSAAMTDEFRQKLQDQARKDAEAGVYDQDGAATALRQAQMAKTVSPDRDTAIEAASKVLKGSLPNSLSTRLGSLPYNLSVSRNAYRTSAAITDQNGETIASYDSRTGVWRSEATKAERQFETTAKALYDEAYKAAGGRTSFDQRV